MRSFILVMLLAVPATAFGQAFGIDSRVANTSLLIDELPPPTTSMQLVDAFPALDGVFSVPMGLVEIPDGSGRLVVWERAGKVFVFPKTNPLPGNVTLLLDLSDRVSTTGEFGLLGLAFDPFYATSGDLYIYYTRGVSPESVVARYTNDNPFDNTINRNTEDVLFTVDQPAANHNAGSIAFGPDGMFYIAFGDGGGAAARVNSQDLSNLLGTLLRIDVHSPPANPAVLNYVIPPDNPFVNNPGARNEIFAYGFRNPFRWSFDALSGTIYLGDVGETRTEEINIVRAGENYGWPITEGFDCFMPSTGCDTTGITFPIDTRSHTTDDAVSITGGYVSFTDAVPELYGMYLYSDAFAGKVWGLRYDGESVSDRMLLVESPGLSVFGFGQDSEGEVYVLDSGGDIFVLRPADVQPDSTFPFKLSDIPALWNAGLGIDQTDAGILPYEPSAKLWSDGSLKERFMALPGLTQAGYRSAGGFDFPDNTVVVKNFILPQDFRNPVNTGKRVETRLLVRNAGSWNGFSYIWNESETDAHLLAGSATRPFTLIDQSGAQFEYDYYYPSRSECFQCHTAVNNGIAGITAAQLNFDFAYPESGVTDNQLRTLDHIGFFDQTLPAPIGSLPAAPDPADTAATIADRAQAYLFANCVMCHQPGGPTPVNIDFRWGVPLSERNIFGIPPTHGDMGIVNARRFAPGRPDRSIIPLRMADLAAFRMPPLATSRVDTEAVDLIRAWIRLTTTTAGPDEVWVNFSYGGREFGTPLEPFNTLDEALANVRDFGAIHLIASSTSATPTITKPVTIDSTGGVARIGD